MEGYYEVFLGDQPAGKLQILAEGLYYRLICRCITPKDAVYRLFAIAGNKKINLGVVLPEDDGYILNRKIPKKELNCCTRFMLSSRSMESAGKFVPIYPEEPFAYIVQLENAFLDVRNGQIGAFWKERNGAG